MKETLRQRIGVNLGRRISAEDAVQWAAKNEVYILTSKPILHQTLLKVLITHDAVKYGNSVKKTVYIWVYTHSPE